MIAFFTDVRVLERTLRFAMRRFSCRRDVFSAGNGALLGWTVRSYAHAVGIDYNRSSIACGARGALARGGWVVKKLTFVTFGHGESQ